MNASENEWNGKAMIFILQTIMVCRVEFVMNVLTDNYK